jgi:hypothetical protein
MTEYLVDGVNQSMINKTLEKFKKWDYVVKHNILEEGSIGEQNRAFRLLKDDTIYAYAFLKDPKSQDKPFKLYPYQDLIINDDHPRIIFAAANQIGKSIMLCVKALRFALKNPGKTVLMVSKTLPQAKDLLRQIKTFLNSSNLDYKYDIGDSETKTEIYFKHFEEVTSFDEDLQKEFTSIRELQQSRIICVPATEAALGYAVDLALIDELAFYEDGEYFYKQILEPRTFTTKGQIIVFSNPNGQQGIFWELWNSKYFHKYRFNFLDCPTNTQVEFERNSENKTREQIDSTLLAVFTSPEGGFLTVDERKRMQDDRPNMLPSIFTVPVFIFFDWAKSMDCTVRTIGIPVRKTADEWGDEVFVYEMKEYPNGTPYTDIVDVDLKNLILDNPGKVSMVGWDNTGVGSGIEDFIKRVQQLGITAMPVEFSLENKSRIYTIFKLLAEQGRIHIPVVKECDKQLSKLVFKKSGRGYLQVHHENERDRDDYPDSIAGLCSLIINPDSPPVSITIVGQNIKTNYKIVDGDRCSCGNIIEDEDYCTNCNKKVYGGII